MSKNFTEFVMREGLLNEMPRSEEASYEEIRDKKTNEVKEVIAYLSGAKSGAATRLIDQFSDIEEQLEALKKEREKVKPHLVESLDKYFDAVDAIATRRLHTAKYILTISKQSMKPGVPEQRMFDEDAFFTELTQRTGMELATLKALKDKFTKVIPAVAGTEPKEPTLKPKLKESLLSEDVLSKVKQWAESIWNQVQEKFLKPIDNKFAQIQAKYGKAEPMTEAKKPAPKQKLVKESFSGVTYIPSNDFGIPVGSYKVNQFADFFRKHKDNPEAVQYLADMMEI